VQNERETPVVIVIKAMATSHLIRMLLLSLLINCQGVYSQVGQQAGIGFYGGTSFLRHVIRIDDGDGEYNPDRSNAYYGGIGLYQPINTIVGAGLELGFQQNTFEYRYGTDRVRTKVLSDVTYYSVLVTPSVTLNPKFLAGLFLRLALPVAVKAGNKGSYVLRYPQNNFEEVDYSSRVASYRNLVYVGPEISLGYIYTWKNGNAIWLRGSTWAAASRFWKQSFAATPENPTLKRLSIEVGFRFGTPGLQLMGRKHKE
jgi:hypothetical protein